MRSEVGARRGGTYHRQDHDPTPASETHTRAGRSRDAAAAEHASDARHVRERANNLERASCQHDSGPRPHRALADDQPPCPSAAGAPPVSSVGQLIDARQRRRYEGGGGARRRKPVAVGQSSLERARCLGDQKAVDVGGTCARFPYPVRRFVDCFSVIFRCIPQLSR